MNKTSLSLALFLAAALAACGPSTSTGDDDGDGGPNADAGPLDIDDDNDGYTENEGDCDDGNPAIGPSVTEVCDNGVDDNCDGSLDAEDYDCLPPCDKAAIDRSSVGCIYYAVDTNAMGGPYAIAVSNIDSSTPANVVVEQKNGTVWAAVPSGNFQVGPRSLNTLTMPRRYTSGSAIYAGGAYRITSDLPVIAYQFAPVDGSASYLSDASLLLPASAADKFFVVPAWPYGPADLSPSSGWPAHLQVVGITDGTTVTVTSPIPTQAGTGVPALSPNVPSAPLSLSEGDFLQITVQNFNESLHGSYIEASQPVAVFTSNDCANVPASGSACCCEHLEEQVFGLQTWGTSYLAAQMPRRMGEGAIWHITAQQDNTNVTFTPATGVTGLPPSVVLNARQKVEYEVRGGSTPGDFLVTSDKPIHVNQYTVGCYYIQEGYTTGDPDMVQAIPTEQYLMHYVVLVPGTWNLDFLVLIRKQGSTVLVDNNAPAVTWNPVAGGWETAVVSVSDGVHVLDGTEPFGVAVSGYDEFDSYSYPGGLNQTVINPVE